MKKTLSTVLAILMILSAFVFTTGVSVSAADLEIKHDNTFNKTLVVSPSQLNLLVTSGGKSNDAAIMSVQTLSDGKTQTIRYAPNHASVNG